jgi:hypothetical protein
MVETSAMARVDGEVHCLSLEMSRGRIKTSYSAFLLTWWLSTLRLGVAV